ncbi:MAG: DNA translocase FtsK 4TM domain-containing protein [Candidatus Schekmanbacteria bacterium]|nr:DNA translocase FtsK 4TM domain-containing protein [Candidatus Schekmanbacteria bacterium]
MAQRTTRPRSAASADTRVMARARGDDHELGRGFVWLARSAGVLLWGVTTYVIVALASYQAADPTWTRAVAGPTRNLAGRLGAQIAELLYTVGGLVAWLLPAIILVLGVRLSRRRALEFLWWRVASWVLLSLAACGLLGLGDSSGLWDLSPVTGGGLVGRFLAWRTGETLGTWGAYIVWTSLLACALLGVWPARAGAHALGEDRLGGIGRALMPALQHGGRIAFRAWWALFRTGGAAAARCRRVGTSCWRALRARRSAGRQSAAMAADDAASPPLVGPFASAALPARKPTARTVKPAADPVEEAPESESSASVWPASDCLSGGGLPPLELLRDPPPRDTNELTEADLEPISRRLEAALAQFTVEGKVIGARPGPVITRFDLQPGSGVRVSKVKNLEEDLARAMATRGGVRVHRVSGQETIGIEVPNQRRQVVALREILGAPIYQAGASVLRIGLGKSVGGEPYVTDLAQMPHLLIGGATGSGKSVCLHAVLVSLLMNAGPDQLRLILIDPKRLEFSYYANLPHLREPVVTSEKKAPLALEWCVREMERRYAILAHAGVQQARDFNRALADESERMRISRRIGEASGASANEDGTWPVPDAMPYIVVVIDELADLMMVARADIETSIARLAQKARASGIHLILATQRPSVDVLTGTIKANFPCRIALQVAQREDSRTILGRVGAEHLLGQGDMLYLPAGSRDLVRVHGAFLRPEEVEAVVRFWKESGVAVADEVSIFDDVGEDGDEEDGFSGETDDLLPQAVELIVTAKTASISLLQRRLRVGHARAARLVDTMELMGVVGPFQGSKTREVLWKPKDLPRLSEIL